MGRKFWMNEHGMTIIELLIVVLIIGLLSGIAIPFYGRIQEQAQDKKMMTDMRNLAVAIGIYMVDYSSVPDAADVTELVTKLRGTQGEEAPLFDKDPWGNYFQYVSDGSINSYTLTCLGKDGAPGTLASETYFNVANDTVLVNGMFVASHQGIASIAR